MAVATLSIDLEARLARLEQDLGKASRLVEREAKKMDRAFVAAGDSLKSLFGTLAAGASVSFLVQLARSTIDGIDKLNDLSDATGASVENISALEDVAARTGTTIDTVSAALVRFNKELGDSKAGSETALILERLGLSAAALKKIDPAEALRQTAVALAKFADDGDKARIVQSLFGKSVAEVGPYLKDLATQAKLVGTVTTEQAKEAEKFNQELFKLQKNALDLARDLSGPLVSAVNQTIEAFRAGQREGKGFFATLRDEQLKLLGADVGNIGKEVANLQAQLAIEPKGTGLYASLEKQLAEKQKLLAASQGGAGASFRPSQNYGEAYAPGIGGIPDPAAAKKRLDDYLAMVKLMADGEEQAAKDTTEAWQAWEQQQLKDHKESTEAWALQWKQVFDEIDAEQERAIEAGAALLDKKVEEVSEFAREAGRNIQDALGDTLLQTLDGKFDSILGLWGSMLKRMVAQAAAAQLNQYLLGDFAKTGNIGGAIKGGIDWLKALPAFAGFFADGGTLGAGQWGIAGEAGPEVVRGPASIAPMRGGGPQISYTAHVTVNGDVSPMTMSYVNAAIARDRAKFLRQVSIQGAN